MDASPKPILSSRRPTYRQAALGLLALGVVGACGAAVTLYLQREAIGVRLAFDYLRAHGVPAALRLDRLDLGGVSGSLRLGPSGRPDLTVGRVEAEFGALPAPWRGVKPPPIRALRLIQPVLHARLVDGRIDFGDLQPLVDQAMSAKSGAGPAPDLYIQDGRLNLDTPSGPVVVALDAAVVQGRVRSLHARLEPTDLDGLGVRIGQVEGVLSGQATGAAGLHLTGAFSAARSRSGGGAASGLTLSLEALTPNGPAELLQVTDRPLDAVLRLQASRFALQPRRGAALAVRDADLTLDLDGGVDRQGRFTGRLHATGHAGRLSQAGLELASAALDLRSDAASGRAAKTGLTADGPFTLALTTRGGSLAAVGLQGALTPASLSAKGRLTLGQGLSLQAQGEAEAGGGLASKDAVRLARAALGAVDAPASAVLAHALQQVRLAVPAYALAFDSRRGASLRLSKGAQAQLAGGAVSLQPISGAPVLQTVAGHQASGRFRLGLRVKGLPQLDLAAAQVELSASGALRAQASLTERGGLGAVRDASLNWTGQVAGQGGRWSVSAAGCASFGAGAVQSGGRTIASHLSGQACPDGVEPLLALHPGGWRVRAIARSLVLALPTAQVKAQLGSASLALDGAPQGPAGRVELQGLAVQDTAAVPRVRPLTLSGPITLGGGDVQGRLVLALAQKGATSGVQLGGLELRARPAAGEGRAVFDTGRLSFADKGLQPGDIVPAAGRALPGAQGDLDVVGRFAWTRAGLASSGEVRTDGFSFKSPAGKLDNLRGDLHLASLSPLATAPDQTITADRLETLVPLDDLQARFTLAADQLDLQGASATVAGGRASLDAMRLPLAPGQPATGVLRLQHVDLQKLISVLNLANAVDIQAQLGGALPFSLQPEAGGGTALRFAHGRVYAEGPGRLTIRRQALAGAVATAGAQGAQPNAVQDFAYQALENLAFSQLDASVASRPAGRLGVVFHVVGRHDPAVDRPTRIGLFALLRGHAFDKPLPLPKGTPVELTLDTSLNLDDILAAYGRMGGAPGPVVGSAKVQP